MQIYTMISSNQAALLPVFSTDILYVTSEKHAPDIHTEKGYILFVRKEDWNSTTQELVDKMMKACKLQIGDYDVIPCEEPQISLKNIQGEALHTLLSFGVQFDQDFFRLNRKRYAPFRFHRYKWLLADGLADIVAQENLKSTLWNGGLKPLFGI